MPSPDELVPEILEALPPAYGALLLLHAGGSTDAEIAEALDIPIESVPAMKEVARSKLRRVLGKPRGPLA